jgi:hypothetical protein
MSKNRPHQRDHEKNQQTSTAVRPPLPRDATGGMQRWQPGQLPMGGFRSVIDMSGNQTPTTSPLNTKMSPTVVKEKKVY